MSETSSLRSSRVMLWTSHRCISTAFTRSMGQIPEIEIWYEPFEHAYSAMLNIKLNDDVDLPTSYEGNKALFDRAAECMQKVLSRPYRPEELSYESVRSMLEASTAEHVFVKDIGLAMQRSDLRKLIPTGYCHSFLIRHPILMFSSLHKVNFRHLKSKNLLHADETDEASFDVRNHTELDDPADYYRSLYELWMYVKENIDQEPVVLDASDLLMNPSVILPKYCKAVGLPYTTSIHKWKPNCVDDILSWKCSCNIRQHTSFLDTMISSTGFVPPKDLPSRDTLTPDVLDLADAALPLYEEMYKHRLLVEM